jgi:hypothetical protein
MRRLIVTGKKITRRATVAWRKKNVFRRIGTQVNCGPHKELAAARIRTTRCAKVARGREHGLQRQGKDDIAPRPRKGRKEENKRLKGTECKNDIRYRELRQQFQGKTRIKDPNTRRHRRLKNHKTAGQMFEATFRLQIPKREDGSSVGSLKIKNLTLWRGRPPPKRKRN